MYTELNYKLVSMVRLNVIPTSILDLHEDFEELIPAYPESQGELEHYLRVVIAHKLLEPLARDKYTPLLRLSIDILISDGVIRTLSAPIIIYPVFTKHGAVSCSTHQVLHYEGVG